MNLLIDDYRKGWALRYLREAKADLSTARKAPIPAIAISLAILSMKKSQTSIYYSLGDPGYLNPLVKRAVKKVKSSQDSLVRCLVQIEQLIQKRSLKPEVDGREATLREAEHLFKIASTIVGLMMGEKEERYT